ncbi:MAG: 1,4-dihydroxy-6-naphthoate synthase [Bacteroidales bacterium]|jgi:1,4-dihydroxy-6-naphthoate synthase
MKISLGYSTCPNDTFIFDALVNGKIDNEGIEFVTYLTDVEDLNLLAFKGDLDVTKLSYHAWLHVWKSYRILDAGSAVGKGSGPVLVAKNQCLDPRYQSLSVAIPGEYTTANLLLRMAYPNIKEKKIFVFSDIEQAVLDGETEAGVLIHENRFTYEKRGLVLLRDLGQFWEESTHSPLPLGGIMAHRRLAQDVVRKINRLVRLSLEFALADPQGTIPYMRKFAQCMDQAVLDAHLKAFVNEFSVELGTDGKRAINILIDKSIAAGLINDRPEDYFIT